MPMQDDWFPLRCMCGRKYASRTSGPVGRFSDHVSRPGTVLTALFKWLGFNPLAGCKCKQIALVMDRKGPAWCRENIDKIVGLIDKQAKRRGWCFSRIAIRLLVELALLICERKERKNKCTPSP